MTVLESLLCVNAYPVPRGSIEGIAAVRGLALNDEATVIVLNGDSYQLAVADILLLLSEAPDIVQGGQSYSFTDAQRSRLASRAMAIYSRCGDVMSAESVKTKYGYKGSRL